MRGRHNSLCIVNDNRIFRYFGTSLVYVDRMRRPARRWVFDETCSVRSIGLLAAFRIHRLITPAYRPIESQPAARRRVHATFRPKQVAPSVFSRRGLFPIVYLSASLIPRRFRGRHIFWGVSVLFIDPRRRNGSRALRRGACRHELLLCISQLIRLYLQRGRDDNWSRKFQQYAVRC